MTFGAPVKDAVFVVVLYPVFSLRVDGWQMVGFAGIAEALVGFAGFAEGLVGFAGIILWHFPVTVNSDCRR